SPSPAKSENGCLRSILMLSADWQNQCPLRHSLLDWAHLPRSAYPVSPTSPLKLWLCSAHSEMASIIKTFTPFSGQPFLRCGAWLCPRFTCCGPIAELFGAPHLRETSQSAT